MPSEGKLAETCLTEKDLRKTVHVTLYFPVKGVISVTMARHFKTSVLIRDLQVC